MKVLITGGAGFLGSHLADRLLARGDTVLAIDNYSTGRRDNLAPRSALEVVEGTIADSALVARCFDNMKPDVVIHAAASYKDPDAWHEDATTNVLGTVNVVRAAQKSGVRRLIYFQTALCYGLSPDTQPVALSHPQRPQASSYATSKTAGENYVVLAGATGLDWISFRLANAYGPRNMSGPLPTFYSRLTAGKKCFVMDTRRDFIFVSDLVDVVLKAIDGGGRPGPYHISSGRDVSIQQLFDAAVQALGIRLEEPVDVRPRGPDDAATILLDPSETEREFGWRASTALEDGVRAAIAYYREYGVAETYTHLNLSGSR